MSKLNIAVVEDEGIVAMDIKKSLAFLGYGIAFIADSGEAALEKLKTLRPDIILMDIVLKGELDGIETAIIICELYSIPVIFLTAFEDETSLKHAMQNNYYGFITKPFDDEKLREVIENLQKPSI